MTNNGDKHELQCDIPTPPSPPPPPPHKLQERLGIRQEQRQLVPNCQPTKFNVKRFFALTLDYLSLPRIGLTIVKKNRRPDTSVVTHMLCTYEAHSLIIRNLHKKELMQQLCTQASYHTDTHTYPRDNGASSKNFVGPFLQKPLESLPSI